jgi:hypothetical protein
MMASAEVIGDPERFGRYCPVRDTHTWAVPRSDPTPSPKSASIPCVTDQTRAVASDTEWFDQQGYLTSVVEEEPGVYRVDLAPKANPALKLENFARGLHPGAALAHARELWEERLVAPLSDAVKKLHPVTIINTRYGGGYEGGEWAAFPLRSSEIPSAATGDDNECRAWWADPPVAVGLGATPDRAIASLAVVVTNCPHPTNKGREAPSGWFCDYCRTYRRDRA